MAPADRQYSANKGSPNFTVHATSVKSGSVYSKKGALERHGRGSHARALRAEHVGERLLRQREEVCARAIVADQKPAAEPLPNRVVAVAERRLRDLGDERVQIAQQRVMQLPAAAELRAEGRHVDPQ